MTNILFLSFYVIVMLDVIELRPWISLSLVIVVVSNFNKLRGFVTDYVGFIKKIMKLMLHKYSTIKKIEVELKQLEEPVNLPARPCKYNIIFFNFIFV